MSMDRSPGVFGVCTSAPRRAEMGAVPTSATLDEARSLLEEAVPLVREANRTLAQEDLAGAEVIRKPLTLSA